jgi:hypothetical protein
MSPFKFHSFFARGHLGLALTTKKDLLLAEALAFYIGMPVLIWCICHMSGSESVLLEADSKDLMVPVTFIHQRLVF